MDLTLAAVLAVKAIEIGELGTSGVAGIGGGAGTERVVVVVRAESCDLSLRASAAFRVVERSPGGNDDLGLEWTCGTLPEVDGRCVSSDGRGLGPSLTLGFEYCA
jgi:hypothetical protein